MQDNTTPPNNVTSFPAADKNPLPDIPNGKILQMLIAARERFLPHITPEEADQACELLKANPVWDAETAGKEVSTLLDLDTRRAAWIKKESNIEPMIEELSSLVERYQLFPMAHPRAVAAYLFQQLQGLSMIFQDVIADARKEMESEEEE